MTPEEARRKAGAITNRVLKPRRTLIDVTDDREGDLPPLVDDQYLLFDPDRGKLGTFLPQVLGSWLERVEHLEVGQDYRPYRYLDGVYVPCEDWVAEVVRGNHGRLFRPGAKRDLLAWLAARAPSIGEDATPEGLLNVTNGLLDWRAGTLHPHDPKVLSTSQIPVAWDPAGLCPTVVRFLTEVMPDDETVDLAWEVLGYACWSRRPFHKALLVHGPQGTGKSRFLGLMRGLLGRTACSSVTLQDLAENRFMRAELLGRLANISGDLDARAVTRSDVFKSLVGGDQIEAERKFAHPFTFTSRALLAFSANELPATADQSDAWFIRWIILPMNSVFRGTDREDVGLEAKLLAELPGVLVRAVEGLRRLVARGRFSEPKAVVEAGEAYRRQVDTVVGFVEERCVALPGVWVDRASFYRSYRLWCTDSGRWPLSAQKFNERLPQVVSGTWQTKTAGRPRWNGVALTDDVHRIGGQHWRREE